MDEFDEVLVRTIDKTFRCVLGNRNALVVYRYLEKVSCPIRETPRKLDVFSKALRDLLGTGRGQILGVSSVLEDAIVVALSSELGVKPDGKLRVFEDRVRRMKEKYENGQYTKARGK